MATSDGGSSSSGTDVDVLGDSQWYNADGSMNYPPNNGAVPGTEVTITLQEGQTLLLWLMLTALKY